MKTISKLRMAVVLASLACTTPTFASTVVPVNSEISHTPSEEAKTEVLLNRLNEIKAMDKSNLTREEKKALRKEVKEIKATMKATGGGVYLSVGAIIIIILLLILIL
ncbi:hypothetical protein EZL74_08790 [Flavobacterium silvisoli]|uniref:Seryl-tRNA synthetase n=1 Tax=Flavobacterium silvisoli TaxID=2529433 RepID=A0A4Q9YZT4_9FLAO|nr:hypothetical protein [Flavobacterium silvisoli]TBX68398.1 hypothetical protein EZL74_08790 [Flavobacterium silvisoli]